MGFEVNPELLETLPARCCSKEMHLIKSGEYLGCPLKHRLSACCCWLENTAERAPSPVRDSSPRHPPSTTPRATARQDNRRLSP